MIGIKIEGGSDVTIIGGLFIDIEQPIVAINVDSLVATGNTAIYGKGLSQGEVGRQGVAKNADELVPGWISWIWPYPEIPVSKLKAEAFLVRQLYASFSDTLGGKG